MYLPIEKINHIIEACNGLLVSKNITDYGKTVALQTKEQMINRLKYYNKDT